MDKWPERQNGGISAIEQNTEKRMKKNKDGLRDLWGNIKCTNFEL